MIGCKHLLKISRVLCKAKCVDPSIPFGGVDIIFFGDFIQFPPVKDSPLYFGWNEINLLSDKEKQLGLNLWRQVNKIVLLEKQMRCVDKRYLELLNRLRKGECTQEDIELLNGRIVGNNVDITSYLDTPIINPGNQLVTAINDLFIEYHSREKPIYVLTAIDYTGKKRNRKQISKKVAIKIKHWACTSTRGLPRQIKLYIGMPVMVSTNVKTDLGVTNGTKGIVRDICFDNREETDESPGCHHVDGLPHSIIVELEDIDMEPLPGLPPNYYPISVRTESFPVHMPGRKSAVNVNRSQFPLVPLFSCTAHKSQGQTLQKAIVDLVPFRGKAKNVSIDFAYVPLSRVRRLEDLTILRPFDPAVLKAKVNPACAAMLEDFKSRDLCKDM